MIKCPLRPLRLGGLKYIPIAVRTEPDHAGPLYGMACSVRLIEFVWRVGGDPVCGGEPLYVLMSVSRVVADEEKTMRRSSESEVPNA